MPKGVVSKSLPDRKKPDRSKVTYRVPRKIVGKTSLPKYKKVTVKTDKGR
jgi:hypothetical protein